MVPRRTVLLRLLLGVTACSALASAAAAPPTPARLFDCHVVRPPANTKPRAFAFFLGGAFVGAAPGLAYSNLLAKLADAGYVVFAPPFRLEFDYLELCDAVLAKAEPAHCALVEEFGALPVVGVGHSCGALLHVLLSSVFRGTGGLADVPRAANVLISFNNKPAQSAIPLFGELVAPAASSVLRLDEDPLLLPWKRAVAASRERLAALSASGASAAARSDGGPSVAASAINLAEQFLPVLDQIEPILREIDGGKVEFSPTPDETTRSARMLYEAKRTLVVRFLDDSLDESPPLPALLQNGGDVRISSLAGTHLTPLTPADEGEPPLPLPVPLSIPPIPAAATLAGARRQDFDAACEVILDFLRDS